MTRLTLGVLVVAGAHTLPVLAADAPACDANSGGLTLPAGFCALVAADNLGTARHLAVAANGDVYLALMDGGGGGTIFSHCQGPCRPQGVDRKSTPLKSSHPNLSSAL